ncbi:Mog1p/PsbP-like protein [Laetiporus sulphureus 93-53]|uniref:Mog1p/PsbP-like protein n=1 Tax=Laetiporus sulphureus 93-53 TaxID=1314785 RepID=A0A165HAP5_9APHY|nr:Mog1p/PsbP-like protein [Laetiporus sulphureus 93-53]KZT11475.1 Mog1p/PsbP-like protein [Laetiporus sulphureus 93-53]
MTSTRDLFGGAITATFPTRLIDASDLRQIPDTQEVFLYPESNISIIVEILQSVAAQGSVDIARFHFDSLAHDNDAEAHEVVDIYQMSDEGSDQTTPPPTVLTGTQLVRKFNKPEADEVRVLLAVYRLQPHNVDLVLSMNVPTKSADGGAVEGDEWRIAQDTFAAVARSLKIVDYSLFA